MQASIARCTNCGADTVFPAEVNSAFWHGERLVIVEKIPALRCTRCGEQFYDDATMVALDLMRGRGFDPATARRHVTVPVFSLFDAVALERETPDLQETS